jgi:two-component system, cell cycle sensor histidine kinase and response regulator CckA
MIPITYLAAGGLWVFVSDRLLAAVVSSPKALTGLQTVKDWLLVAATAALIHAFARREADRTRRFEDVLSHTRDFFSSLLDDLPVFVWRAGPEGTRDAFNRQWLAFTGRTRDEEAGEGWFRSVHPDDRDECRRRFEEALRRRAPFSMEYRLRRHDGEHRWIADAGKPVYGQDGTFSGYLGAGHDIEERKKRVEEALRANTVESIATLAGGIAHDFNNLLTAILGNVSIAKIACRADAELVHRLSEAEAASLRAQGLTRKLLTFSESGAPVRRRVSLSGLIRRCVEPILRGTAVRSEYILPPDLFLVSVDEGQIAQAIGNVVRNAVEAMPRGGIAFVRAENVELGPEDNLPIPEGEYVRLSVSDEGEGIPQEQLLHIFEPFFTTKKEGSGLGLATAYIIVRHHDGFITAESTAGSGTTIHIYLPAYREEVRWKADEWEGVERSVRKGKVLIMDDEEMVRDVAACMLETMGFEVTAAPDGAEALREHDRARKDGAPFDIIVMDLTVPGGMGGKEAIGWLRKADPGVKAIVSSGYSNDPVMVDYRRYGFRAILAKPYRFQDMRQVVRDVLAKKKNESAA